VTVSVVIPTRDRWGLVSRAVRSALAQADVSLEVLVVDDGSTTPGPEWLRQPPVAVHRSEVSLGVAHARNIGIERAAGDWVAFLDDDDVWAPGKLRAQLDQLAATGADFAYSAAAIVDADLRPTRVLRAPASSELRDEILARDAIPAGQSNVVARTALIRELGGFDEQLSMLADWEMWIRLVAAGAAATCPGVHVAWVIHEANMHLVDRGYSDEFEHLARRHPRDRATRRRAEIFEAKWRAHGHRRAGERRAASREYLAAGLTHRSPGMLARAVGVLAGEWAMGVTRSEAELPAPEEIDWLEAYR
jgi:glycosyltransferase involved in cell wall biosynthesis